jgi:hypothetical protein
MKNKILSMIAGVACLLSCNDDFLQRNSLTQLSQGSFWASEEDAVNGVNAIYNSYRTLVNDWLKYGMLDDFSDISYQTQATGMTTGVYPANGAMVALPWRTLYAGIYRANTAMQHIPGIDMNDELKQRLIGEAKFLRAFYYFKLWDLYGGVPIYTEPMNYDEAYKPRNTPEEVYELVVEDLTDAISVLPESYPSSDAGRATKWAAVSLRGKAKLYAKKYSEAAVDFKDVIDHSDRDLHPVYAQLFNYKWENNKEIIYDVQYIMETGYGNPSEKYYGNRHTNSVGWQQTAPTPALVNTYEMADGTPFNWSNYTNAQGEPFNPDNEADWDDEASVRKIYENRDARLYQTVIVPWSEFTGKDNQKFIYKWSTTAYSSDPALYRPQFKAIYGWRKFVHEGNENTMPYHSPNNIPVIRFADVLLMYAESKNEAEGPDQSVYDAIDRVRTRASLPGIPAGTKDEVRERIRHERKVEFAGEGVWHSDIRRWKIGVELCNHPIKGFVGNTLRTRAFGEREYLWGIPSMEIDLNPSIQQNPGWD